MQRNIPYLWQAVKVGCAVTCVLLLYGPAALAQSEATQEEVAPAEEPAQDTPAGEPEADGEAEDAPSPAQPSEPEPPAAGADATEPAPTAPEPVSQPPGSAREKGTAAAVEPAGAGSIQAEVTLAITERPLEGARLEVVGTTLACVTREDGRCTIEDVPAATHQVRAYLRGHRAEKRSVVVPAGRAAAIVFVLARRDVDLEEIVVTGTATATARRELGHSVGLLRAEDLAQRPIVSLEEALSASVSGVTLMQGTGMAGAAQALRIRGVNSISQGNAPLIYVDGVRVNNDYYPLAVSGPNQAATAINDINPNDIDRIEIIKGSAATTLYGTEAAGGVIQVFTKSGRSAGAGKPIWDVKVIQGFSNLRTIWGPREPPDSWFEEYTPKKNQRVSGSTSGRRTAIIRSTTSRCAARPDRSPISSRVATRVTKACCPSNGPRSGPCAAIRFSRRSTGWTSPSTTR